MWSSPWTAKTSAISSSEVARTVKAIVCPKYGLPEVLQLREIERPTPKDNEVLIKVVAVSVNRSDWEGLTGKPFYARIGGLLRPRHKILGSDIAGRVEMTGRRVTRFRPGDEVFGDISAHMGGFAEYVCAPEGILVLKPTGITFENAAAIPQAAVIALQGIRDKGQVRPGQKVLVNGAGGGTGTFAIQLAKSYGAEVTGVDNTGKLDFMLSIGADHVIDYTKEDFTKNGKQYDVILDVVADGSVFSYKRVLGPNGRYFAVGGTLTTLFQILLFGPWIGGRSGKKIRILAVRPNTEDIVQMAELCESGKVVPVIGSRYSLSEIPDALRSLGEGSAKGKTVIIVEKEAPITRPQQVSSQRNP
jgi:NADPH:quinone reductase-like Zn-dependent oxidoreductase